MTWAARGELPVEIAGPHYLVADVTSQPEKRRMLVHLVNYSRKGGAIKNVAVRCRAPEAVKEVKIYSPDAAPATVPAGASFSIPEVKTYAVAAGELVTLCLRILLYALLVARSRRRADGERDLGHPGREELQRAGLVGPGRGVRRQLGAAYLPRAAWRWVPVDPAKRITAASIPKRPY